MKNKNIIGLFIGIGLTILLVLGISYQQMEQKKEDISFWKIMPEDYIIALEAQEVFETFNLFRKQNIWQTLLYVNYLSEMSLNLEDFENIAKKMGQVEELLHKRRLMASLHFSSSNKVGALLYVPFNPATESKLLEAVLIEFKANNKQYRFSQRRFKELNITEILNLNTQETFSFIIHQNLIIGTFTSILLDDVIRKIDTQTSVFSLASKPSTTYLQKDKFTVYVNNQKMADFLQLSLQNKDKQFFKPISNLAENMALRLMPAYQKIILQGNIPVPAQDSSNFFNIFGQQTPSSFSMKSLIPQQTALLYHMNFSYANKFAQNWKTFWQKKDTNFIKTQAQFANKFAFSFDDFYKSWDKELAICFSETESPNYMDKIILIKLQNTTTWNKKFQQLAQKLKAKDETQAISEKYNGYVITQINEAQFPAMFLGDFAQNFTQVYYVIHQSNIAFFSSSELAKKTLDAWNQGKTWAENNPKFFLAELDKKANFSCIVNLSNAWNTLYESINPDWQNLLKQFSKDFFEGLVIQFTQNSNVINTNFQLKFNNPSVINTLPIGAEMTEITQSSLPKPAFTAPILTTNFLDNSSEILIQDYQNTLFLASEKGKFIWKRPAGSPIRSKPIQLDIYKNNRLQYAFVSTDRLHLIDRLGRNVPTFPLFNADTTAQFQYLTVLDLKRTKDYLFMISDTKGQIYLYNSNKHKQIGWKPKKLTHKLSIPPQHFKVQNKDYVILAQENGYVQVFDMEGNEVQAFMLDSKVSNPFWVEIGADLAQTTLTNVTEKGLFLKVNLQGQYFWREQVFLPNKNAQACLLTDAKQTDWLLAVKAYNQTQILDKKGQMIFEINTGTANRTEVQFFNLDASYKIIAITDKGKSLTHLVDMQGKQLCEPLKSTQPIEVIYKPKEQKITVFYVYNQFLRSFALRLK